jgi:putative Mg2+ transporter-C (MgtC) family protein
MNIDIFRFDASTEVEMLLRILIAALVGGIIGFERRRAARPAGIRTLALVAMGAGAFTVVSIFGFAGEEGQMRDPARIAAQVATGVGFIGAGTMIRSGGVVRGLTTAAGIWMSAALGVAAGAGMFIFAIGGALIATMILSWLPRNPDSIEEFPKAE